MRTIIFLLLCCLPAAAQSDPLLNLSFTKTVEVSVAGESQTFVYEMFVRDDYRAGTVTPVAASVRFKKVRVAMLDNVVTADVRVREFVTPEGASRGDVALVGLTVFDLETGLPARQLLTGVVSDKNGRAVPVQVAVTFSGWKRRKVEVRVLEDVEVSDVGDAPFF